MLTTTADEPRRQLRERLGERRLGGAAAAARAAAAAGSGCGAGRGAAAAPGSGGGGVPGAAGLSCDGAAPGGAGTARDCANAGAAMMRAQCHEAAIDLPRRRKACKIFSYSRKARILRCGGRHKPVGEARLASPLVWRFAAVAGGADRGAGLSATVDMKWHCEWQALIEAAGAAPGVRVEHAGRKRALRAGSARLVRRRARRRRPGARRRRALAGAGRRAHGRGRRRQGIGGDGARLRGELVRSARGLVVTRHGHAVACERIEIVEASHPVPDPAGEAAARRILDAGTRPRARRTSWSA